ncbi:MAG TPA: allophanate hydrolase [Magnetospirillaceae bacterium]|jgi:allophanate hydrolase
MAETKRPALTLSALAAAYDAGTKPADVIAACHANIAEDTGTAVWLTKVSLDQALAKLDAATRRRAAGEKLPLYGVPFAVKDNIDVAGLPTTAACPAFARTPSASAHVVERLEAAGAILLGKTNLDQFATGLSGARSPYGVPSSVFDARYISGGSSSGSAVAVASGLVSFALGTDTAGSGRVPAAFNNIVGLKPSRGRISTTGLVPACRSIDCISIFAGSVDDTSAVAAVAGGFDPRDPFSRRAPANVAAIPSDQFRFGVPAQGLEFFGDKDAQALFEAGIARLESLGGVRVAIDFEPFRAAAQLLYSGPWVAERLAAIKDFAASHSDDLLPVIREIILGAGKFSAVDAYEGEYRLAELARRTEAEWAKMDLLLVPTTPTTYRIDEMLADPIRLNSNLGIYTNFTNLLDLSAIAVPAGFRPNGLPFGVTLIGHAFQDDAISAVAARLHGALDSPTVGATGHLVPATAMKAPPADTLHIAVVGAHLSGQPLNRELTERNAQLVRTARTKPGYRLYALKGGAIAKPGLLFDGLGAGGIELEVWALSASAFGSFVAAIPPPMGIGTIALDDGTAVKGFICEPYALKDAADITAFGGWRAYLKQAAQ